MASEPHASRRLLVPQQTAGDDQQQHAVQIDAVGCQPEDGKMGAAVVALRETDDGGQQHRRRCRAAEHGKRRRAVRFTSSHTAARSTAAIRRL